MTARCIVKCVVMCCGNLSGRLYSILAITCGSVVWNRDDGAVYSEVCGDVLWQPLRL